MMKVSVTILFYLLPLLTINTLAQQAGDLDNAFGSLGISIIDNNGYDDIANSSVLSWNGKIIIGGTSVDGPIRYMSILRLGTLGTPDVSFSDDGWQTISMSGFYESGSKVLMQGTRPVLAGYSEDNYLPRDFVMYRFRGGDGELDEIFGDNGIVVTDFSGNGSLDGIYAGAVLGNKIFLAGETEETGSNSMFALAKYNLGGDLDFSFGNSGLVTTDFATMAKDRIKDLAVEPEGKIIAVGESAPENLSPWSWALARYNSDGSLDNSFGTNGKVVQYWAGSYDYLNEIALLPGGKFLVAGKAQDTTVVARFNSNGTLDNTFGSSGKTKIIGVNPHIVVYGNKIFVATSLYSSSFDFDFVLTRLSYNGQIDNPFGNGGSVITAISPQDDISRDIHIQSSGRIILTGETGFPADFVAVGYHNDPFQVNVPFYIVDEIWNQGFINFSDLGDPGVTAVDAVVYSDSTPVGPFNDSFVASGVASRFYEITVTPQNAGSNSSYNASLKLYYSDADIQGINENKLKLVRLTNDGWIYLGGTVNTSENYVEANNVHDVGILAFADPDSITNVDSKEDGLVNEFRLEQNYPNPFNPSTKIKYTIPSVIASGAKQSHFVSLKIYDVLGNEVATLVNEYKQSGSYEIEFNAAGLSSGIYFYKLQAGGFIETKKMILLR
ncbi:MAG: T9SS type A sorting domain-containing protein [Ignavibacteriaceae bacterium]|nr:T9SS type A sorting domain-containing protein [Ignavibacteriaceae bacterium]